MSVAASCASRAALEELLAKLRMEQDEVTDTLKILNTSVKAEDKLADVQRARARLSSSLDTAAELGTAAETAAYLSESVSNRVNSVLLLYNRALQARTMVDQTMALKQAIVSMYAAMDQRDWKRAASAARMAFDLPESVRTGSFAAKMTPTIELPEAPMVSLNSAAQDMCALFAREFKKAAAERKMDQVTRYLKLFPLIGYDQDGLSRYSWFISEVISGQSRSLLLLSSHDPGSTPDTNPKFYGLVFARLFENVAVILAQHAPLIERHYTKGSAMTQIVEKVQIEIDTQSGLIIDTWWDERRLDRVLSEVKSYSYPALAAHLIQTNQDQPESFETADLATASQILAELTTMLNRWALYRSFIEERWPEALKSMYQSELEEKIDRQLRPAFDVLALFVFRRSVEKAVDLDELPPAGSEYHDEAPLVSTMIDDVMYVLRTLLEQIEDAGDKKIIQSSLPSFRRVLEGDYMGTIQRKIRDSAPSRLSSDTQSPFLIYLNDLIISSEYIAKIVRSIFNLDQVAEAQALVDGVTSKAQDMLESGCQTYFAAQLSTQIRTACTTAFKGSYMLSPTDNESNKAVVFEGLWRKTFEPLQKQLNPSVYKKMVSLSAGFTARLLEKYIWLLDKKVNEMGAIALDRDISRVLSVISESDYNLRDKFVRVCQIVMLIGDEEIETVLTSEEEHNARHIRV